MSVGVWSQPDVNWTHIKFGGDSVDYKRNGNSPGGGGIHLGGGPGLGGGGKHCIDLHERLIPHGVHYVPGPDECTLCACDDGEPKWCKAVLCSPPQDCKSFRVGNSCCEFICLDDSLAGGNGKVRPPKTGGPYLSGPVEVANFNFVPKVVIAAVTAMLSLSLLFFLIHRLRQRHIQAGRLNSARARRSTQTCDECDDTRSLDFSNDFFEHRMNSPHLYPPQYLAWWKPPSSYFPPRGEAPPPYEEAMMATTSIGGGTGCINTATATATATAALNLQNNNSPAILNHIPIIVPPTVLPPGPVGIGGGRAAGLDPTRSSPAAIQRLASAIANTTNTGGSTTCTTSYPLQLPSQHRHSRNSPRGSSSNSSSKPKSKSKSRGKDRRSNSNGDRTDTDAPQPGPSRSSIETDPPTSTSPIPFRIGPPQHGPAPPTYEDAIYSLNPDPRSAYYLQSHSHTHGHNHSHPHNHHPLMSMQMHTTHRHSLTLPHKRLVDPSSVSVTGIETTHAHVYPRVVVRGISSSGVSGGSQLFSPGGCGSGGPMTVYTEEELLRRPHLQNQRLSLQFPVGGDLDNAAVLSHGPVGGEWSSSSSTLSLSTTPNSPVEGRGRAPSLSSSSESSVSENPPPPPAPSNNTPRA